MNSTDPNTLLQAISHDEGVQRVAAGVVVALVADATKRALFSSSAG